MIATEIKRVKKLGKLRLLHGSRGFVRNSETRRIKRH